MDAINSLERNMHNNMEQDVKLNATHFISNAIMILFDLVYQTIFNNPMYYNVLPLCIHTVVFNDMSV